MHYPAVATRHLFSLLLVLTATLGMPAYGAVLNIEDFGAASGGGDDSSAFEAAFAAASAGDTVQIPAGSYQITRTIRPKGGTLLAGAGATFRLLSTSAPRLKPW